jgi:hypothetical protein
VVVLSDFLDPAGFEDGLGRLHHQGHEVWALLVESPEEVHPAYDGEMALLDAETGREAHLRVTPERVAAYLERRQAFLERFDRWTTERGIPHLRAATSVAADELVLEVMRRGGFVK